MNENATKHDVDRAIANGQAVIRYVGSTASLVNTSRRIGDAMSDGGIGRMSGLLVVSKATAARKAVSIAKLVTTKEQDVRILSQADHALGAAIHCGGAALSVLSVGFTGPISAFIAVTQIAQCGKSLADWISASQSADGRGVFETHSGLKWLGLGIDTAGVVASALTLRGKYGSLPNVLKQATKSEQVSLAFQAMGLSLGGGVLLVESLPTGQSTTRELTEDHMESLLRQIRLYRDDPFRATECWYLKTPACILKDVFDE